MMNDSIIQGQSLKCLPRPDVNLGPRKRFLREFNFELDPGSETESELLRKKMMENLQQKSITDQSHGRQLQWSDYLTAKIANPVTNTFANSGSSRGNNTNVGFQQSAPVQIQMDVDTQQTKNDNILDDISICAQDQGNNKFVYGITSGSRHENINNIDLNTANNSIETDPLAPSADPSKRPSINTNNNNVNMEFETVELQNVRQGGLNGGLKCCDCQCKNPVTSYESDIQIQSLSPVLDADQLTLQDVVFCANTPLTAGITQNITSSENPRVNSQPRLPLVTASSHNLQNTSTPKQIFHNGANSKSSTDLSIQGAAILRNTPVQFVGTPRPGYPRGEWKLTAPLQSLPPQQHSITGQKQPRPSMMPPPKKNRPIKSMSAGQQKYKSSPLFSHFQLVPKLPSTSTPGNFSCKPASATNTPISSITLNSSGESGSGSSPDCPNPPCNTPDMLSTPRGPLDQGLYFMYNTDKENREGHNAKERKRRARIKDACQLMRDIVPGMSDKTDKATVFEFSAQYILYLQGVVGTQFDKEFLRKYNPY